MADPSETAQVRAVTRLFAQRRQASVEIRRRGGEVAAAALHLGSGSNRIVWRRAALGAVPA